MAPPNVNELATLFSNVHARMRGEAPSSTKMPAPPIGSGHGLSWRRITDTFTPLEQMQELRLEPLQLKDDPALFDLDSLSTRWWFDVVLCIFLLAILLGVVYLCRKYNSICFHSNVLIATTDDDVQTNRQNPPVEKIEMRELTVSPLKRLKAIYEEDSGSVVEERVTVMQDP